MLNIDLLFKGIVVLVSVKTCPVSYLCNEMRKVAMESECRIVGCQYAMICSPSSMI